MKVNITHQAESDLAEIKEYITRDNPQAARKVASQIRAKILKSLRHSPYTGTPYDSGSQELRVSYVGNYGIYYRVTSELEIIRILHQKRNVKSILH